jgi:hypothetical protein
MGSYSSNSSKLKALFAFIYCRFGAYLILAKLVRDAKAAMKAARILQKARKIACIKTLAE